MNKKKAKETKRELYDRLCQALTWYENPNECPLGEDAVMDNLYNVAVDVQNRFFEEED